MPLRTAALLILTGFALATAFIFATETTARPGPAAPVDSYDPFPG